MEAKKSLGQNFFVNNTLADKIVNYVRENTDKKKILEIGPGRGYFTEKLMSKFDLVLAIEKDDNLAWNLKSTFPDLSIINSDILLLDIRNIPLHEYATYGSLPYNISKRIISLFMEDGRISDMFFIVQKEVAEKYTQKDTKSSILSMTSKIYADFKLVMNISPASFRPMPKVESSLIHIKINKNREKIDDIKKFVGIIHRAFSSPRKKIRNNLKEVPLKYEGKRAEDITFEEYINIYNEIKNDIIT